MSRHLLVSIAGNARRALCAVALALALGSACAGAPASAYAPAHPKRVTWFVDDEGQVGLRKGRAPLPVRFIGSGQASVRPVGLLAAVRCDDEAAALMVKALLIPFDAAMLRAGGEITTEFSADFVAFRALLADAINRHNEAAGCVGES